MSDDYAPQAWRFGDGMNQFYADHYATTSARLDYDLDYDESRYNQHKAEFLADLAAHDAEVAAKALRGWVSGHCDDPHDDDYCDEWVRGYHAAMRSVLTAAGHMEREGGSGA